VHVTVVHGRHVGPSGLVIHQSRHLERRDRTWVAGIPATGVARTLVDLAAQLTEAELIEAVDRAVVERNVMPDEVRAALERAGLSRSGRILMQRVLEAWTPGPLPGSVAEMRLIRRIISYGLPSPVRQYEVYDDGRFLGRVDGAYPDRRVALEYDGEQFHLRPNHARANDLTAAGWQLFTATAVDLRPRATRFYEALSRALAQR
jgi:hypothetical protein